jgi:two-component system response regulator YesN
MPLTKTAALDETLVSRVLTSFAEATDLYAMFVDLKGNSLMSSESGELPCFCQLIQSTPEGMRRCRQAFERAGRYSYSLGESYIYSCHAGLVEWAAPIVSDETGQAGTVITGQVSMWPLDDQAIQEILEQIQDLNLDSEEVTNALKEIDVIPGRKVRALADMLFAAAGQIMHPGSEILQRRRLASEQQALLADTIQQKKLSLDEETPKQTRHIYPFEKEQELVGRVRLGDRTGAREILNEILGDILFNSAGQPAVIKARIMELLIVLSRAAVEGGAKLDELLSLDHRYMEELAKIEPLDELCAWIVEVLDEFVDIVYRSRDSKYLPVLQNAADYIKENYARDLTLEEVAQAVHISPYYLSHLFKEELGVTFIGYLTKVRIEQAKILLLETNLTIQQISYMVGYQDSSYFTKVFKKLEGRTPTQFRR